MRRVVAVAMAMTLAAFVAAGCGGDDGGGGGGEGGDKAGEGMKIGLVTDTGGLNDRSFNTLANQGLERAEEEFGVDGQVLESKSPSDYEPNLSRFAQEDYDLVIGVGFLMADSIKAVSAKFPDTNFAIIDFSYGEEPIPNVRGLLFQEHEAGYLAGSLAGMVESEGTLEGLNPDMVVSAVGGQSIPPVNKFIAGFQAGVMEQCAECEVLVAYSQDFTAQDRCKELALSQIQRGSDIVFQVAGGCGLGALDAANSQGVWGIGVDADQAFLGDHILTSAMKRVDVAVYDSIESVVEDEFAGGEDAIYGTAEEGVGLGEVSDAAAEYEERMDEIIARVEAGEVDIPEEVQ